MEKQFAASEVRRLSNRIPRSNDEIADAQEALRAFANLLEADEKAVPVAWMVGNSKAGPFDFRKTEPSGWVVIEPLYTHSAQAQPASGGAVSPDAETLIGQHVSCIRAEALAIQKGVNPLNCAERIVGRCDKLTEKIRESAQPPAASVTEALRLLQSVLCDTDGNCCIRGTYEDRRTVDKALAMLAAQENPNG